MVAQAQSISRSARVRRSSASVIVGVDGATASRARIGAVFNPRPEPSVIQCKWIGIDTSKTVFTPHGIDHTDQPTLRTNLPRAQLPPFFQELLATEIVMEAYGAAYHWGRQLTALGHNLCLIPSQYVKRGKNDRKDATAVSEAGGRRRCKQANAISVCGDTVIAVPPRVWR